MKYKKGDKVVIKPWALMEKQYGVDDAGDIKTTFNNSEMHCFFMRAMEKVFVGTDRVVTMQSTETARIGGTLFEICDDMILGYAFEYGEEIEISGDGKVWDKRVFLSYSPGSALPVSTVNPHYRAAIHQGDTVATQCFAFARPIQPDIIEITCKVNGKEQPLSYLSEETLLKIRRDNG